MCEYQNQEECVASLSYSIELTLSQVSDLDLAYQRRNHSRQIHSYFYGGPAYSLGKLSPHSIHVKFEDLKIYRVGEGMPVATAKGRANVSAIEFQVDDSALPIGAERTTTTTQLVEVDPTSTRATLELVNQVLAIMQAPDDADDETTVGSPILGFVHMCVFCRPARFG